MEYAEHYCYVEPDVRLHYIDEGNGRPMLFVTGFGGSAQGFEHQIEYFKQWFRVIAVDPRNHGKSSYSMRGNTYAQQGRDIGKLIETLGLSHIILAGWSFGAYAALNYLEQFGMERVDAYLTLDNPVCAVLEDPKEFRAGDLDMLREFHFRYFQSEEGFREFVVRNFIDGIFFIHPPEEKAERDKVLNSCLRLPLEVGDQLIVDGHLTDKRAVMKAVDEKLPCLFFVADYRKEEGLLCIPRDYPHSEVVTLGNHMMFYEFPEDFNRIVEDFLRRHGLWTGDCEDRREC